MAKATATRTIALTIIVERFAVKKADIKASSVSWLHALSEVDA